MIIYKISKDYLTFPPYSKGTPHMLSEDLKFSNFSRLNTLVKISAISSEVERCVDEFFFPIHYVESNDTWC